MQFSFPDFRDQIHDDCTRYQQISDLLDASVIKVVLGSYPVDSKKKIRIIKRTNNEIPQKADHNRDQRIVHTFTLVENTKAKTISKSDRTSENYLSVPRIWNL